MVMSTGWLWWTENLRQKRSKIYKTDQHLRIKRFNFIMKNTIYGIDKNDRNIGRR